MNTLANSTGGTAGAIAGILGYIALVAAYWVPSIVAWRRHVPNKGSVTTTTRPGACVACYATGVTRCSATPATI